MSNDRLKLNVLSLQLLCIDSEVVRRIDFGDIIRDFAVKKARKAPVKLSCLTVYDLIYAHNPIHELSPDGNLR